MAKKDLTSPDLYINRELSWLEFNDRVLREGCDGGLPLMERLKFLAIVSSNLDEFFLVRVAGLLQQRAANLRRRDLAGLTPLGQLDAIGGRAHRMVDEQALAIEDALGKLRKHGLRIFPAAEWDEAQQSFLRSYFNKTVFPVLTPLAVEDLDPCPLLAGMQLHVAAVVAPEADDDSGEPNDSDESRDKIVAVPVPSQFARFITMPAAEGIHLARLEDVIAAHLAELFPGYHIQATAIFRITRDADVAVNTDEADDLLQTVAQAVLDRRRRAPVRVEISAHADSRIKTWLVESLELRAEEVYDVDGMLDATALMELAERPGFDDHRIPDWPPQTPRDLLDSDDLWQTLQDHDVLLFHPYEKFDPIVELLELAADDPQVLAIKQTLYRTSGDSPIVLALERASQNGKEVTVLVELMARFDEARNVGWARRLEDAGCHVIYGVAGLKTHAKALLIVRRQEQRIRRYVHLATGNYNDKTARVYSDIGLITSDNELAGDVAAFFNLLTGYSETVGWSKLAIAPTGLRQRFIDLIDREAQVSTPDRPGLIMAKANSLQDPAICQALYRASQAGVNVMLNIRGICCLRPGVKGVSENIQVRSIIDRFLEHARIFYFRNGGHEEVYLSSADWMQRNLAKRLELLFPITDAGLRRRVIGILKTLFADNMKARELLPDGTYDPVPRKRRRIRAQETFHKDALEATRAAEQTTMRFRPLTKPQD